MDDLSHESLWLYSLEKEKLPDGFQEIKTHNTGTIRTGQTQKCGTCRGHGQVTCKTCGGKIRWTERSGDTIVEKICSCGNGKQICGNCSGYGDVETVIDTKKTFRLFETKNSQYKGEVPENKIKKITGNPIFEHIIEYPMPEVKSMLVGGIQVEEFNQLQKEILDALHNKIDTELHDKGVNTKLVHEQLNILFNSIPNPVHENKLLSKEVMPVRVMVRVENAPVTQIDYAFKKKSYTIWVFGNENRIWYKQKPISFNYKMITIIISLFLIGMMILLT